jgi:hypothetical protein
VLEPCRSVAGGAAGRSIEKGKGQVIISRISITQIDNADGVSTTCFGSSGIFLPSRPSFNDFSFLIVGDFVSDCEDSPSSAPFHFLKPFSLPYPPSLTSQSASL